jgi:hypothetical protein
MAMPRTPEQIEADDGLTDAITKVIKAYHGAERAFVLSEYVVLVAQQGWEDDGDSVTAMTSVPRDGDVPIHRLLGLVEYASTRYRATIAED